MPAQAQSPRTTRVSADVALPARANEAVQIGDPASGIKVGVRLLGAGSAEARSTPDGVAFDRVLPHADVTVHRAEQGFEDFIHFAQKPGEERVRYELDLTGVAGLRQVDRVLELLDATGTPRLRMARPWIRGADGRVFDARVEIVDCAVDVSPKAPWGRTPIPPGRSSCTLEIAWERTEVSYPATLDPAWSSTGDMVNARSHGSACQLLDARVLVVGGYADAASGVPDLKEAELFDPVTKTFAATAPMVNKRATTRCVTLPDGRVLVAGGSNGLLVSLPTSETYALDGTWESPIDMPTVLSSHTLTLTGDGRALAVGGRRAFNQPSAGVDAYDPFSNTWSEIGTLLQARLSHSSTLLANGNLLVAGGGTNFPLSSVEEFDPVAGVSASRESMAIARDLFELIAVGPAVYALGGSSDSIDGTDVVEAYDLLTGTWQLRASMPFPSLGHIAAPLGSGRLLVAGGFTLPTNDSGRVYQPETDAWSDAGPLTHREDALAVPLLDGSVLILGGRTPPLLGTTPTAVIFMHQAEGATCIASGECVSSYCVDGVCCNGACDGNCEACNAAGSCVDVTSAVDPDTCVGSEVCDADAICKSSLGAVCSAGVECASAHCVDGVCCNETCGGTCQACDISSPGTCDFVVGAPRPDRPECPAGSTCTGESSACESLALCKDGHIALTASGVEEDCSPFACTENGVCRGTCSEVAHCAVPFLCDTEGRCVDAEFSEPTDGCASSAGSSRGSWLGLVFALFMLASKGIRGRWWPTPRR